MIDPSGDELITLPELARQLPAANGKTLRASTCFRWATVGLRGHRLEVVQRGGRMLTTMEAYKVFAAAITRVFDSAPKPSAITSARKGTRTRKLQTVG